jgi:hypothetical protein
VKITSEAERERERERESAGLHKRGIEAARSARGWTAQETEAVSVCARGHRRLRGHEQRIAWSSRMPKFLNGESGKGILQL